MIEITNGFSVALKPSLIAVEDANVSRDEP